MNRNLIIFLVAVFVLLFGGIAYYFYYIASHPDSIAEQRQSVDVAIDHARKSVKSGADATTVAQLERSLSQAVDKTQEAKAKMVLASAYIATSPEKSIDLDKEISLDTTYPVAYRSTAGNAVVEYYLSTKNVTFAKEHIFTGPTWGDFMKGSTFDSNGLEQGVIHSLEWVASITPSFPPEYALAYYYGQRIGTDRNSKYIPLTKDHVQKGDVAFQTALDFNKKSLEQNPSRLPPFLNNRLGIGLEHKVLALVDLYNVGAAGSSFDAIHADFKEAIDLLEKDKEDMSALDSARYTRFHLAVFLVRENAKMHAAEVASVLAPVVDNPQKSSSFYKGYLTSYGSDARLRGSAVWSDMVLLGKSNTKFKTLLLNLGWKEADLK